MIHGADGPRLRSGLVLPQAAEAPAVCITRSALPIRRKAVGGRKLPEPDHPGASGHCAVVASRLSLGGSVRGHSPLSHVCLPESATSSNRSPRPRDTRFVESRGDAVSPAQGECSCSVAILICQVDQLRRIDFLESAKCGRGFGVATFEDCALNFAAPDRYIRKGCRYQELRRDP
jgi:hypothetical protein